MWEQRWGSGRTQDAVKADGLLGRALREKEEISKSWVFGLSHGEPFFVENGNQTLRQQGPCMFYKGPWTARSGCRSWSLGVPFGNHSFAFHSGELSETIPCR